MPNSYVFPGGTIASYDFDFPQNKTNYDLTLSAKKTFKIEGLSNDLPLRVAAIRELFEETGLLLTYNENCRESKLINVHDDSKLDEWRIKVIYKFIHES